MEINKDQLAYSQKKGCNIMVQRKVILILVSHLFLFFSVLLIRGGDVMEQI